MMQINVSSSLVIKVENIKIMTDQQKIFTWNYTQAINSRPKNNKNRVFLPSVCKATPDCIEQPDGDAHLGGPV